MKRARWLILLLPGIVGCQSGPMAGMSKLFAGRETQQSGPLVKSQTNTPLASSVSNNGKVDVMLAAARSLESSQQHGEAIKAYEQILRLEPNNVTALHRMAVAHDRNGRPDLAEPFYQKALAKNSRSAAMHCDFGYSCYLRQEWAQSEKHLRQAVAIDPTYRRAQNNLGMLLARTSREAEGLQAFAGAGLSEAEARNNVAFALSLNRRLNEAADQYAQAISLDPNLERAQRSSREVQQLLTRREAPGTVMPTAFQGNAASIREAVVRLPEEVQP